MPVPSPRCCLDPGWLFVAAGLGLCAAGMLVPARQDVDALRAQRAELVRQHQLGAAQVQAHEAFLGQLRRADPAVIRRLAAAQLNLVPAGATPVLVASSRQEPVSDWIAGTVPVPAAGPPLPQDTWLTRLTGERFRLWVLAGGLLAVFVGLLAGPDSSTAGRDLIPRWRPDVFSPRALGAGVEWDEEEEAGEDEMEDESEEDEELDEEAEEEDLDEDEEEDFDEDEEDDEDLDEEDLDEDEAEDEDEDEDLEDWDEEEEEGEKA